MAKQSGIHQLRGKINGMSYYGQKYVTGGLVRKINEGMSERVKTDPAFANTRLNAQEFGAAGSTAGVIINKLPIKWRYILNPFTTGYLTKLGKRLAEADATNPWGERYPNQDTAGLSYADVLNMYAKNSALDYIDQVTIAKSSVPSETRHTAVDVSVVTGADKIQDFIADTGADNVRILTRLMRVHKSTPQPDTIYVGAADIYNVGSDVYDGEDDMEHAATVQVLVGLGETLASPEEMIVLLVVLEPRKIVNSEPHVLQEKCALAAYSVVNSEFA